MKFRASFAGMVKPFMAHKDIRYYINGINVRPCAQGGVILCATDGHRLAAVHDKDGECEQEVIVAFNAPTSLLKHENHVELKDGRLVIWNKKQGELFVQPGNPVIDGKYPDYLKVIPGPDQLVLGVPGGYQARYLADLYAVAEKQRFCGVAFYHRKDSANPANEPLVVRYSAFPELVVMVMPISIDKFQDTLPEWVAKLKAAQPTPAPEPTKEPEKVAEPA